MSDRQLATRINDALARRGARRWTLNGEHGHYHAVVDLAETPLILELRWRRAAGAQVRPVGVYRLDLQGLLKAGFIRTETTQGPTKIRVRVVKTSDSTFRLQVRDGEPHLNLER